MDQRTDGQRDKQTTNKVTHKAIFESSYNPLLRIQEWDSVCPCPCPPYGDGHLSSLVSPKNLMALLTSQQHKSVLSPPLPTLLPKARQHIFRVNNYNKAGYTANTSRGRVGRGRKARFCAFEHDHYQQTDRPIDGRTDGQSLL